jgi:putative ABC transport system permease protein
MFRPLPYRDPSRLVGITWVAARGSAEQTTYVGGESIREMEDWRAQRQIFVGVEPSSRPQPRIGPTGVVEPAAIAYISTGMLDLLGVRPKLGRGFLPEEGRPGNDQVALLSYGYWLREFGGDPAVLGKTVTLDKQVYTVVGVMPRDFPFAGKPNAYAPWTEKSGGYLFFTCRIRPGLNLAQAEREAALVSDRIHYRHRVPWAKMTPELLPFSDRLSSRFNDEPRTALLIMMGAVGFLLLIACANVANLLLSRGATRQREVAIRSAIGASRGRLVRHFLMESMVLAAAGIYGVLSYSVAQRASEIGVRMALGATARDIRRLVVRAVLAPVSAGIVAGVIGSLWLTRLLRSLLYQITPHDPLTIILVAAFLLLVSLAATYLPARRASQIDPMTALRVE